MSIGRPQGGHYISPQHIKIEDYCGADHQVCLGGRMLAWDVTIAPDDRTNQVVEKGSLNMADGHYTALFERIRAQYRKENWLSATYR